MKLIEKNTGRDYEEIVNASDKKILIALDAELEEISHKISEARHTGVYDARAIAYKAMQKKY